MLTGNSHSMEVGKEASQEVAGQLSDSEFDHLVETARNLRFSSVGVPDVPVPEQPFAWRSAKGSETPTATTARDLDELVKVTGLEVDAIADLLSVERAADTFSTA